MGFNLTTERIQDTYQQLLQISGSSILDGTGSIAAVSIASASHAAYAITASYALNGGGGGGCSPNGGIPSGYNTPGLGGNGVAYFYIGYSIV